MKEFKKLYTMAAARNLRLHKTKDQIFVIRRDTNYLIDYINLGAQSEEMTIRLVQSILWDYATKSGQGGPLTCW